MKTLLIIGGNSTSLEIRECAELFYNDRFENIFNVIGDQESSCLQNLLYDGEVETFLTKHDCAYIIGFTNQNLRMRFNVKLSGIPPISIIHPSSYISPSSIIGNGTYIGATAVISSKAIVGERCIINIASSIGHDSVIGNDCVVNPGARISGHCYIGNRTLVGANAFVFQGKSVGDDCLIDSLTYIDRNIEDKRICTSNTGSLRIYKNRF
jgi:carbonic anhydrase/acetyltransferase-like protein (isoleucine patch superfamily)